MEYRVLALGAFLGVFTFFCALIVVRTMGSRQIFTPFNLPSTRDSPGNSVLTKFEFLTLHF
jgi:hypothetical protein